MAEKQRTLEVAAFLDSAQRKGLSQDDAKVRKIVGFFVEGAYKELGKEPRLLDGHDAHVLVGHVLPGRLKKKDPLAEHVPDVLRAYIDFLEETEMVPEAFELRRGFEGTLDEFKEAVRTGHAAHHGPKEKVAPVIHQAPKLGRNDPCSCGSGKKFKKCHGKP